MNCTNFTIGEKFRNFMELYNGHLWNYTNFSLCWTICRRCG